MSVAAAIIAGGRAKRMGGASPGAGPAGSVVAKGLLLVEGRRIIDRQLEVLRPLFAEVLIVASDALPWLSLGLRVVPDRVGGGIGPLAGVDAALAALSPGVDAVVCVAADMPFLAPGVLALVRDEAPGAMAVAPRIAGRPEPLLARYARDAAPIVGEQIARGAHAMTELLARLSARWIEEAALRALDPELRSILNVNTPEDLARLAPSPARPGGA